MSDKEGKQFLIIFHLRDNTSKRLAEDVPKMQAALGDISTEPVELAFRSDARDIFGFGIRTKRPAGEITAILENPGKREQLRGESETKEPFLYSNDNVLILELAKDKDGRRGFSRFTNWMDYH